MKSASAGLITLLNTAVQFVMADLYTFTLVGGTVLRYSAAEIDLVVGGNTYSKSGLKFERGKYRAVAGLEVDQLDVTIYSDANALVSGVPFQQFVRNGGLDGAQVKLERFFSSSWTDTSNGTIALFVGRVSTAQAGRTVTKLTVKSLLELLDIPMPRNIYQPGCLHTLYDAGCTLNKSSFSTNMTCGAGGTKISFSISGGNAGKVMSAAVTNGGHGFTSAPGVGFSGGGGSSAAGTANMADGVYTISVTNGGMGYTTVPGVVIGGPGAGASATAVLTSGVGSCTIDDQGDYPSGTPTVSFIGGGGTGAAGTAVMSGNRLVGITITDPGSGYTAPPTVALSGGTGANDNFGRQGSATAVLTNRVGSITVNARGTGFTSVPGISFSGGGGGSGAAATAAVTKYVLSITMTNNGSGYTGVPSIGFSGGGGTEAAATAAVPLPLSDFLSQGTIAFTSGLNNGVIRTIKNWQNGTISLAQPLPSAPANGDTVTVAPGCDKAKSTCLNKFNNLANFRGFPYVPIPETAR